MRENSYIIHGGSQGRERMRLVAEVLWPGTLAFLAHATPMAGKRVLDLGCGGGDVTLELARFAGSDGCVLGLDFDPVKVAIAQDEATVAGLTNVRYCVGDAQSPDIFGILGAPFDIVYARCFLSHLTEPDAVLRHIRDALAPNGQLLVEDVDFGNSFCTPKSWAFDLYVDLYQRAARRRGADPEMGASLGQRLASAGFKVARRSWTQPTGCERKIKLLSALSLEAIAESVVVDGVVSSDIVSSAVDELYRLAEDSTTVMSTPRIVQVSGTCQP
ncbi:class I SAM-dependent methyltransferase [Rhizobium mongolense]|uniref:class I SAM-dependent methyltransferase n=1 Tax=Rhizobium TaxID=379 RepID=UPI00188F7BBB|nr:class I SAM-dependent methyltransferase [Rhizobium sp. 007]QPB24372.1 class I SAM-dependent methyltransferase [Rhizobium sp. 007]